MGLFWRRKKEDRFITLGLNEPSTTTPAATEPAQDQGQAATTQLEPPAALPSTRPDELLIALPVIEPTTTGGAPTPPPPAPEGKIIATPVKPATQERHYVPPFEPSASATPPAPPPRAVPSRSPFTTSVLGLDRSMEELQAEEAALEQAFATRFSRAISATRESLSERIDTVFQGRKQIDAELLDELEEALVAADIGVPTTLAILDKVRRGIARKQINDIAALKSAIKDELLTILQESENQGVASEESVPESVAPYVIMIVGVN
ncbi:MAG TPA: signal recognition particle receptor subunit alpha, partial [Pyrinomonadaceae bacterium]|nr:signal recognition particle receptor subunit alpha [Pyrinomonadaceae bacterium]